MLPTQIPYPYPRVQWQTWVRHTDDPRKMEENRLMKDRKHNQDDDLLFTQKKDNSHLQGLWNLQLIHQSLLGKSF